eukprot:TRINITY_DN2650_c0_g1_i3.p1 TRINITY_DN2650_c0_g1~~TRINITY_DN2650_c0_g1_i3.p1  ORF type:complete len:272 (-),score=70.86 TRINITY_DN2650_c0_g1_i3:97-912(-)
MPTDSNMLRSPLRPECPILEPERQIPIEVNELSEHLVRRHAKVAAQRAAFFLQRLNVVPLDAQTRETRRALSEIRLKCDEQKVGWEQLVSAFSREDEETIRHQLTKHGVTQVHDDNVVNLVEEHFPQSPDTPTRATIAKMDLESRPPWNDYLNPSKFWKRPDSSKGTPTKAEHAPKGEQDVMSASDFLMGLTSPAADGADAPDTADNANDFLASLEKREEKKAEETVEKQATASDWFSMDSSSPYRKPSPGPSKQLDQTSPKSSGFFRGSK